MTGPVTAGRCVSATDAALGGITRMPPPFAPGEAAGTAALALAALALKKGVPPRRIPIPWLRRTFRDRGAGVGRDR